MPVRRLATVDAGQAPGGGWHGDGVEQRQSSCNIVAVFGDNVAGFGDIVAGVDGALVWDVPVFRLTANVGRWSNRRTCTADDVQFMRNYTDRHTSNSSTVRLSWSWLFSLYGPGRARNFGLPKTVDVLLYAVSQQSVEYNTTIQIET